MKYKHLYIAWGILFAVCAALGFVSAPQGALLVLMRILTVAFFVPPAIIVFRAKKEGAAFHLRLVRNLAIAWIAATGILLAANVGSVAASAVWGSVLYALLTVVCAPLVCSNAFLLPIFLWGMLLTATLGKAK